MQCDICLRTGGNKLPFLCPTDARNQLYETRVQHAKVLIEKDALDKEVSAILTSPPGTAQQNNNRAASARQEIERTTIEREQAADRTRQIIAHADELRAQVVKARAEIARRKADMSNRRAEREVAAEGLAARRERQVDEVEKSTRIARYRWNNIHDGTAMARAYLCNEAAKLYGLQRVRKSGEPDEYMIGGVGIVDLKAMNTASPAQISTALSHIVHLLILSTHYLGIRLPAEITLPHRDYPRPTIFPPLSSYRHTNVPFPGTVPGSASGSPAASSHEPVSPPRPRPRPLFITKPLPLLSTEDPAGYALFLEGVTLLAYDIAWLCKSQGIAVGSSCSFDDICNLGRNLFDLLLDTDTEPRPLVGVYSHGTAHSFLGNPAGVEFTRGFKIASPTKLVDRLRAELSSEVAQAEWEVVDADAWAADGEVEEALGEEGVVVGGPRYGMQSFMSMRRVLSGERRGGTSGWTKLKPR